MSSNDDFEKETFMNNQEPQRTKDDETLSLGDWILIIFLFIILIAAAMSSPDEQPEPVTYEGMIHISIAR